MKTKTLLIAAVTFLALSVSAYAQTGAAYTVSQETLDRVACCGLAEPTGAIVFTSVEGTPETVTGTITIRYNLPITNGGTQLSAPDRVQIRAVDDTGTPLVPQPTWVAGNDPAFQSNGLIVIAVPAGYDVSHTIKVFNVRVNVTGNCGSTDATVTANASSSGNFLTIGETASVTLVKGVAQPLKTPVVSMSPGSLTQIGIDASNGTVTGTATFRLDENFITAFGTVGIFPEPNRTQQTLIRLKVSPIQTGLTVTFPGAAGSFGTANSAGTFSGSDVVLAASPTPQYVYYVMTAASNPAAMDSLSFSPTVSVVTSVFPLAPGTITVSAAMAPITTLTTADRFPQFIEGCETAAVNLASVSGALNTILLVPYAPVQVGYDTGITVANTTLDPGTANMGNFTQAISQTGKIVFYFFPKSGPAIAPWVSTSHPSVHGLDLAGKLPAGGTFSCLLSELLPVGTTFEGYVFVVTDFTNAHGEYFISDWEFFTHGALMLVVSDNARFTSGAGRTQEQGLNQ